MNHRGVLRAAAVRHRRHADDGRIERTDDDLPRAGNPVDCDVRPGRVSPNGSEVERIGVEVLPARIVLVGVFSLWRRADLRRNRQHEPDRHCGSAAVVGSSDQPGLSVGGADADRAVLQSGGGAISHLDAGRLRRRADAGHRIHVRRTEGRRLCGSLPDFPDGVSRRFRIAGRLQSG